jgi:hypothetical protein
VGSASLGRSRSSFDRRLTWFDWEVADDEKDGGGGSVGDGGVAPVVPEVEGEAYRLRRFSEKLGS